MSADETEFARLERALVRVLRGSKQRMARRNSRLEGAGYILLASLEKGEPARMSDIAAVLRLDASTVSRQVRSLEEAGLVRREPDPADGRATRLLLNDEGRAELTLQRKERHAVLAAAMAEWSPEDRAALGSLLGRLADDVESPLACAARTQPARTEPAHAQPAHAQPAHAQPAHTEPARPLANTSLNTASREVVTR